MRKKRVDEFLSGNLDECIVNYCYIERLRKSHLNHNMPRLLSIGLEDYQENSNRILLMMRREGFDVVVISNNEVFSVEFFNQYNPAKAHYNYLKQLIFETKEEKW